MNRWRRVLLVSEKPPDLCRAVHRGVAPRNHPKDDWSWVFIGRTDAEGETPILWPPDVKGCFIGKEPDIGKD